MNRGWPVLAGLLCVAGGLLALALLPRTPGPAPAAAASAVPPVVHQAPAPAVPTVAPPTARAAAPAPSAVPVTVPARPPARWDDPYGVIAKPAGTPAPSSTAVERAIWRAGGRPPG